MNKTYYKEYKLLKDTPQYPAGWPLKWNGSSRKYFFRKASEWKSDQGGPGIYHDYEGQSFSLEEVESKPDWFKPVGEATSYVPAFPSQAEIGEYAYLELTTRLVDDVDVCRAMNELFNSNEFKDELYLWVKLKYEQLHFPEKRNDNRKDGDGEGTTEEQ